MRSIQMAGAALISVALFLGLAIWGEGGVQAFFAQPPLVFIFAWTVLLTVASLFTTANLSSGKEEDRSNRWVLAAFGVLGILIAWLPAYADRKGIASIASEGVRWFGALLYALGGVLRIWPVFTLGRRFSGLVAIQQDHHLVTRGIYSIIRHPSYLGMLILLVGWALAFGSLIGLILAVLSLVPIVGRIRSEEALLLKEFGTEYEQYRRRTFRLLPGIY